MLNLCNYFFWVANYFEIECNLSLQTKNSMKKALWNFPREGDNTPSWGKIFFLVGKKYLLRRGVF